MSHGTHWSSAVTDWETQDTSIMLKRLLEKGTLTECLPLPWQPTADELACTGQSRLAVLHLHEGPIRWRAHVLVEPARGGSLLLTACPELTAGIAYKLHTTATARDDNVFEGVVQAELANGDGPELHFFATDFARRFTDYQTGGEYRVALAGLAYDLANAETPVLKVANFRKKNPEHFPDINLDEEPDELEVATAGASMLLPIHGWNDEDYQPRHFETRNVLIHIRKAIRVTADGRRVLFLDEVQSDWHADVHAERDGVMGSGGTKVSAAPFKKE